VQELKGNVRTFLRLRPSMRRESGTEEKEMCPIDVDSESGAVTINYNGSDSQFKFDRAFGQVRTEHAHDCRQLLLCLHTFEPRQNASEEHVSHDKRLRTRHTFQWFRTRHPFHTCSQMPCNIYRSFFLMLWFQKCDGVDESLLVRKPCSNAVREIESSCHQSWQ